MNLEGNETWINCIIQQRFQWQKTKSEHKTALYKELCLELQKKNEYKIENIFFHIFENTQQTWT